VVTLWTVGGSVCGIKLIQHVMNVVQRVLEQKLRDEMNLNEMQFGFTSGRRSTDAVFILRQLQEKY